MKVENCNKNNIYPLLESLAKKMYDPFKEVYKDLAMDFEDVTQENYLYYLDFTKRFAKKFRKEILFSAIKRYVIWKNLELIYNYRKKKTSLISMDTEMGCGSEELDKEGNITEKILKGKGMKLEKGGLLGNSQELDKFMLKMNPKFNVNTFKKMLGEKKFNIFMDILAGEESDVAIGKKYKISSEYVDQVYDYALKRIKGRFM
jgi:hypothetical protein